MDRNLHTGSITGTDSQTKQQVCQLILTSSSKWVQLTSYDNRTPALFTPQHVLGERAHWKACVGRLGNRNSFHSKFCFSILSANGITLLLATAEGGTCSTLASCLGMTTTQMTEST